MNHHPMERDKQSKPNKGIGSGGNLFRFLPGGAASAVSFQNQPFSPGRSSSDPNANKRTTTFHRSSSLDPSLNHTQHHRMKSLAGKGFSGPLMIPTEARRRSKKGEELDFQTPEPASPKVSCIGQVKHKKNKMKKKTKTKSKAKADDYDSRSERPPLPKKQGSSVIKRIFGGGGKQRRAGESKAAGGRSRGDSSDELAQLPEKVAPALGQMRRFTSGREAFAGIDWSEVQVAPVDTEQRNYHSDEERDHDHLGGSEGDDEEDDDDEVMIPFSAPILIGGSGGIGGYGGGSGVVKLEPKKEINLWKRRTMAPPRPLQLHPSSTGKPRN